MEELAPSPLQSRKESAPVMKEPQENNMDYKTIVEAVAKLLQPSIVSAVETALASAITGLKTEIRNNAHAIAELQQRISMVEEDNYRLLTSQTEMEKINAELKEKIEDLENRSRRNNLRIVGLPEDVTPNKLLQFCQNTLPSILQLDKECPVERAHRLGQLNKENMSPRHVIVRYLKI